MSDSPQGGSDSDFERNLLEQADFADAVKILRQRIRAADAGEPGIPAEKVLSDIRQRLADHGRTVTKTPLSTLDKGKEE